MTTWPVRPLAAVVALLVLAGCHVSGRHHGTPGSRPFTSLHKFSGNAGGKTPNGVTAGPNEVIYGTTQFDGNCQTCGIIYRLTRQAASGRWAFKTLHSFVLNQDGITPAAPLTLHDGKLYGTTSAGGDPICGCGVVFTIGEDGGGYRVLHTFRTRSLGATPVSALLIDDNDVIFGTTSAGGQNGTGVVFRLGSGDAYSVLHDFIGGLNTGPRGDMVFGDDGAIYGTQFGAGQFGHGLIFRITKAGAYSVLYDFRGLNQPGGSTDGASPDGRLAVSGDGTISGTTSAGGNSANLGTAWSIKKAGSNWRYTQLHIFGNDEANVPHSGLVLGTDGSLYGTGSTGGTHQAGALFQLQPPNSGGHRAYRTLQSFTARDSRGDTPRPQIDFADGVIYGSTLLGGQITSSGECTNGCGTVFSYQP
jgi:uncharacterized repeat protein (TIGR03803 family)